MPRRKLPPNYHALAEARGFRWLGPEVPNTRTKTSWECKQGHRWEAIYDNIRQGSGCPICAGLVPRTPADYYALAKELGFRWLGPEVANTKTKTGWECQQSHYWEADYNAIDQGNGCPVCADRVPKTPADYHALAKERGFHWLGSEVLTTHTKTEWECEQGHRWETAYHSIQQGRGCPVCADRIPKKATEYHALAKKRAFHWLGPKVPTIRSKTGWECEQGHRWEAPYGNIRQGSGCPVCAIERRREQRRKMLADYHALAEERSFRWLGPKVPNADTKTGWQCEQGHCWEAPYHSIQQGRGCPICAIERRGEQQKKTVADYHTLAEARGFRWLGPEVSGTDIKTGWECEQGHRWEARYSDIRQGSGCPICAGRAPKTPDDYHALAKERSFRWLGPEVPNTKTKTGWECEQGHYWEAHYNALYQGNGCPDCADLVQGVRVSQIQRNLCEMLGGELNLPFSRYNIDVAVSIDGIAIAVEYDSWFWHGHNQEHDARRDKELIVAGWRVLHVKSNKLLPTRKQIDTAIARLLIGETQVEIVLDDWGNGPTRFKTD